MSDYVRIDHYGDVSLYDLILDLRQKTVTPFNIAKVFLPESMSNIESGEAAYLGGEMSHLVRTSYLDSLDGFDKVLDIWECNDGSEVCQVRPALFVIHKS